MAGDDLRAERRSIKGLKGEENWESEGLFVSIMNFKKAENLKFPGRARLRLSMTGAELTHSVFSV